MRQFSVKLLLLLCVMFLLSSCSSLAALLTPNLTQSLEDISPGNYRIDHTHSTILFSVNHMGFSRFIGRFNTFQASLDYDAENIKNSRLHAIIEMDSIDVNSEDFENTLRSRFWLNTEKFPRAEFKTVSATLRSENEIDFQGELTFLGITQPVELKVRVNGAAFNPFSQKYTLGFDATASFLRSDFGLDRYIPTVGDTISIDVSTEFQRESSSLSHQDI